KSKLQSKVSVLVREGVSSTTGPSVGSGGSIAVVFCRDNESRSPFLKPCSEPLSLNSCTSSPSSSLTNKGRRRKKNKEKSEATGSTAGDVKPLKTTTEVWSGPSLDVQPAAGEGRKSVSPQTSQAGPTPCSSSASSSSIAVLPPSSSPPRTPPSSVVPSQDTRESSPDSQTVDSSCKTPEPSFLPEECPSQTSPNLPASATAKSMPPDNASKSYLSPPCLSSSAGCGLGSLSLPLSSSDPSSSSVSSSSASKPPPPHPPTSPALPWSLQTGVDCTTGGVLALTALLFKMEEANIASRAKAQEFIQATSQILSQANQSQSQHQVPVSSASTPQILPPPTLPPPPGLSPAQFILHSSLPLGGGCAQTPPSIMPVVLSGVSGSSGDSGWDNETKDPDKYLKKLHTQERAVEEVKLAIKPYYQRKDINKDEYKDILRKAVHKICHSRTGEINPVKVGNLVKLYVQRYKYFRKHGRKMGEEDKEDRELSALHSSA
uniref:SFR19-like C-terminal domain-containing protein n=1 Tax=Tetraodon nigroviridis TaxID=99883 RepID=H3CBH8_TETNG